MHHVNFIDCHHLKFHFVLQVSSGPWCGQVYYYRQDTFQARDGGRIFWSGVRASHYTRLTERIYAESM
jgi:hypothetical protein